MVTSVVEYGGLIELIGAVVFLAAVPFFLPAQWRGGKWNDRSRLVLWAICLGLVLVAFLTIKFGS